MVIMDYSTASDVVMETQVRGPMHLHLQIFPVAGMHSRLTCSIGRRPLHDQWQIDDHRL